MIATAQNVPEYRVLPCDLGWLLVARQSGGLCRLTLGDSAEVLVADLHEHFPNAQPSTCEEFEAVVQRILGGIASGQWPKGLPLALQGTDFQKRVWAGLQRIPAGQTVSYYQLAAMVDQPRSVRAVAAACAANPVALLVPCHRVLRSNGELSGYRWGVERKRALLQKEGVPVRI